MGASPVPRSPLFPLCILPHPLISCYCFCGSRQWPMPLGWGCPNPAPPWSLGPPMADPWEGASGGRMPRSAAATAAAASSPAPPRPWPDPWRGAPFAGMVAGGGCSSLAAAPSSPAPQGAVLCDGRIVGRGRIGGRVGRRPLTPKPECVKGGAFALGRPWPWARSCDGIAAPALGIRAYDGEHAGQRLTAA